MKKEVMVVAALFVISFTSFATASHKFSFYDNFESYALGYNTTLPKWIPQYSSRVSTQQNSEGKYLFIDSISPYQGDRDVHSSFYKIFYPSKRKKISLEWDFTANSCNQTFKAVKGISPQASTGYLYYNNPQDFISAEFKVFANLTSCGNGVAQISAFKRVNGTSYSLIPYTTYSFEMNKTYTPKLVLESINYTSYKISVYLNGVLVAYSDKINPNELKSGQLLIENGGATTLFDNVRIKEYR